MKARAFFCFLITVCLTHAVDVRAQWPSGITKPVGIQGNDNRMLPDGSGGVFVVCCQYSGKVYMQRLNSFGQRMWGMNGRNISVTGSGYPYPQLISDGAGGVIVVWYSSDAVHGTLRAQRVDASGDIQWAAGGVLVSSLSVVSGYDYPIVSDGAGGAIIAWQDWSGTPGMWVEGDDIYAQRINAAGALQWGSNGVRLAGAQFVQENPVITSDGSGGAIIAWVDWRNGDEETNFFFDTYVQRVDALGSPVWVTDGIMLNEPGSDGTAIQIVTDGAGGAIISWGSDQRRVQRMNASGVAQWANFGVPISTRPFPDRYKMIADGSGGAFVAWSEGEWVYDLYCQRLNADGIPLWTTDGVPVSTANGNQMIWSAALDGTGGMLLTWNDLSADPNSRDIYAQRLTGAGTPVWQTGGVVVAAGPLNQANPSITTDGGTGAIVAWAEANYVWAQRIATVPSAVGETPSLGDLEVLANYPNPFAFATQLRINVVKDSAARITVYDVAGRRVRDSIARLHAGTNGVMFDGRDDIGRKLPSGVYLYRVQANGQGATRKIVIAR